MTEKTSQSVELHICLTPEGAERYARNDELYPWDFCCRVFSDDSHCRDVLTRERLTVLKVVTCQLPAPAVCAEIAAAALRERIEATKAEAAATVTDYQGRINNLLALSYEG